MTDTTASLRMACAMLSLDIDTPLLAHEALRLQTRLADHAPFTAAELAWLGPRLLQWAEACDVRLAAVVRGLLDGTPTQAPGMGALELLSRYPGQEAREQARNLNMHVDTQ